MKDIIKYMRGTLGFTIEDRWLYYIYLLMAGVSALPLLFGFSWGRLALVAAMSGVLSFGLVLFADVFRRLKAVRLLFLAFFVVVLNVMCITDVFLLLKFHKTFDDDIYFVVCNASDNETTGFFETFVDLAVILKVVGALVVCNGLALVLSREIAPRAAEHKKAIGGCVAVMVAVVAVFIGQRFAGRPVLPIKDTNVVLEFGHPLMVRNNGYIETKSILKQCVDAAAHIESNPADSTIYVVILGESHNKSHTSLYDYPRHTMPRMEERRDSGELVVFSDCIATEIVTHKAIKSVMSLSHSLDDIEGYALFPALFHAAGYHTECYDNQFVVPQKGEDEYLLMHLSCNPEISAISYDYRNTGIEEYDGDMVKTIAAPTPRSMVYINLNGQHFTYSKRMPDDFDRPFTLDDYKEEEEYKREYFRDYDNATRYVDSLLDVIIKKYEDYSACVIYFSDHGEEVWDDGNLGHGGRHYQRQYIPFFIWGSEKYRKSGRWADIEAAADLPITTNDVSHVLLDLAGIRFRQFDPSRSFVNKEYKVTRDE